MAARLEAVAVVRVKLKAAVHLALARMRGARAWLALQARRLLAALERAARAA